MNSAKIKPYKFLNPSFAKKDGVSPSAILAVNRIGMTLQTQGMYLEKLRTLFEFQNKFLNDLDKDKEREAGKRRDAASEAKQEGLGKVDAKKDVKPEDEKKSKTWIEKLVDFFKPIQNVIAFFVRAFIIKNVLDWLGDKNNTKKIQNGVEVLGKFLKIVYKTVTFGIGNSFDGIVKVFGGIDKIKRGDFGGFKDGLLGIGQLMLGIGALKAASYLLNPFSLIEDILKILDKLDGKPNKNTNIDSSSKSKPTSDNRPTRVGQIDAKGKRVKPGDYVDTKTGKIVKKETLERLEQRYGKDAAKRVTQAKPQGAVKTAVRNTQAAALKGSKKLLGPAATKAIGKVLGRIPFVGGLIDFAFNLLMGEPLGKAAAKAVGSTLGTGLGAVVGTVLGPAGTWVGGLLGGIAGDWVAGSIYDWLTKNKGAAAKETEGLQPGAALGAIVTGPQMTLVGEGGEPEVIIPLSKLGTISNITTIPGIVGATALALDRMGAIGNIIMPFVGSDIRSLGAEFGEDKPSGVSGARFKRKTPKSITSKDTGGGFAKLIGDSDRDPSTMRGMLKQVLLGLIDLSGKNLRGRSGGGGGGGGDGEIPGDAPATVKAMLEAIAGGEGSWNSVNPSTNVPGLSEMTISDARRKALEVADAKHGSGAMGKWQQMPQFILGRARSAGLDPDKDKFNKENQTKIARMLMASVYPGGEKQLVIDAQRNPLDAAAKLRGTWPSLPGGSQENAHSKGFLARFRANEKKFQSAAKGGMIENRLVRSASELQKQRWSYTAAPDVGCAPAINEVYRRAGVPIPWSKLAEQQNWVPDIYKWLASHFWRVQEKVRKAADIVIWEDDKKPPYGHIGMVMPDGSIANNSTSQGAFVNRMQPNVARAGWPGTKKLHYFRHPNLQPKAKKSKNSGFNLFASFNKLLGRSEGGLVGSAPMTPMAIPSKAAGGAVKTPKVSAKSSSSGTSCTPSTSRVVHEQMSDSVTVPIIVPFPVETQINSQSTSSGAVLRRKPLYRG